MVVVAKLHTVLICKLAELFNILIKLGVFLAACKIFRIYPRNNDILAAYFGVGFKGFVALFKLIIGNVCGNGGETCVLAHFLYFLGSVTEKACKFNSVIPEGLNLFKGAGKICLHIVPYRIKL